MGVESKRRLSFPSRLADIRSLALQLVPWSHLNLENHPNPITCLRFIPIPPIPRERIVTTPMIIRAFQRKKHDHHPNSFGRMHKAGVPSTPVLNLNRFRSTVIFNIPNHMATVGRCFLLLLLLFAANVSCCCCCHLHSAAVNCTI